MDERSGELVLTYAELGERLGITPDSARLKAKRKADRGEWAFVSRNSERDPVRVRVPASALPEHPPERAEHKASDGASVAELLADLKASIAELREVHSRADRAGTEAAEARLHAAVAAAKLEAAERRTEIEIAARNAVIEELRAELARLRRPWWQRLMG